MAVIAQAAEQGVIEFIRFRGRPPPTGYSSPFILKNYDPDGSRKRPQPDSCEEESQSSKRQKKNLPDDDCLSFGMVNEERRGSGHLQGVSRHWPLSTQLLPGSPGALGSGYGYPQQPVGRGGHAAPPYGTPLCSNPSPLHFDPRSHVHSNMANPAMFDGTDHFKPPGVHSHHPMLMFMDTGKLPSTSRGHRDSDLEPGEVVSPNSSQGPHGVPQSLKPG